MTVFDNVAFPLVHGSQKLRRQVVRARVMEALNLVRRLNITTLYVTHDQLEALSMSDTVAVVRDGRIVQEGSPQDVYHRPSDIFAASFLGQSNLLDGLVISGSDDGSRVRIETSAGDLDARVMDPLHVGDTVTVGFHPEALEVLARRPADGENILEGKVATATFAGDVIEYEVEVGDGVIRARGHAFAGLDEGHAAFLRAPADRCYVLTAR